MPGRESENWQRVSQFVSDLRNASRLAAYVDTVVDVYESGAWREYTDASGRTDTWREAEFDYFLIACGAEYGEIQRLLTWDRVRAVELASAMESDDSQKRRTLEEASVQWQSPSGIPLAELANRQGWTKADGRLRAGPAPQRARVKARHGLTKDEHARQTRAQRIPPERRTALDRAGAAVVKQAADDLELRYLVDRLRDEIARRRANSTTAGE